MIEARIQKSFPARRDVDAFTLDVHLSTHAGVAVLFGPSGAGKSLMLDSIAGFVTPDEGRILVDDVLLYDGAAGVALPPRRRSCGYVFQSSALFPHMTLRQNLAFAATGGRLERERRVGEMIDRFRLEPVAGLRPDALSGGQRQRGSIARALLAQPRLLLLDEPSSGLDGALREELYTLLDEVRREFATPMILVTHDLDEALAVGEEIFVMQGGRVLQSGLPAQVLDGPVTGEVARLLGRFNIFDAEILALDPSANSSRLRGTAPLGRTFEIDGPYFAGHLLGARLRLGVRFDELEVHAGRGEYFRVDRVSRRRASTRIEFGGGLVAEVPGTAEWEGDSCRVRFPAAALRVLKAC